MTPTLKETEGPSLKKATEIIPDAHTEDNPTPSKLSAMDADGDEKTKPEETPTKPPNPYKKNDKEKNSNNAWSNKGSLKDAILAEKEVRASGLYTFHIRAISHSHWRDTASLKNLWGS